MLYLPLLTSAVFPSLLQQIFLEDAGFDWKILGPDVHEFDYVAWQVRLLCRKKAGASVWWLLPTCMSSTTWHGR